MCHSILLELSHESLDLFEITTPEIRESFEDLNDLLLIHAMIQVEQERDFLNLLL